MITIENISKSYGKLKVLKNISLSFMPGEITAIMGPNGSGKTTLLKSVLGLVRPDSGDILIDGASILRNDNFRSYMGYMPQISHFPENLKIPQLFRLLADLRNVRAEPEYYVNYFGLDGHYNKRLSDLSGGTRQKVSAILAFIFDPKIIILDEPTVGLDPAASLQMKDLLKEERRKGKTIVFTSHIIPTVEEIADKIIFILEGEVCFKGTVKDMNSSLQQTTLERSAAYLLKNNGML